MSDYTYVIEQWNDTKGWIPYLKCNDNLQESSEIIFLLEEILPHREYRIAQYKNKDLYYKFYLEQRR